MNIREMTPSADIEVDLDTDVRAVVRIYGMLTPSSQRLLMSVIQALPVVLGPPPPPAALTGAEPLMADDGRSYIPRKK